MSSAAICVGEKVILYKDTNAILDYIWDWSDWLGADADTLSMHLFTVSNTDLQIESSAHDDTTATVWLSGGEQFTEYAVVCHVMTAAGRKEDRTLTLICTSR